MVSRSFALCIRGVQGAFFHLYPMGKLEKKEVSYASLGVFENNPQDRKCYEQAGFSLNGEISGYLKVGGRSWAVCEMEAVFHGE